MFKTFYKGNVEMLGSGVYTSNWMSRRSVVKIGNNRIRNVMTTDLIDSYLENAVEENESEASLSVGWCMFFRWALAIKHKGEVTREGLFIFLAGMLTHFVVMSIAVLIFGAVMSSWLGGLGTFIAFIAGFIALATLVLNVKAWMFPGF